MRVLVLIDEIKQEYSVSEIYDVEYDDDSKGIALFMSTSLEDDKLYIPNISVSEVNKICKELLVKGYCDLTMYGEIKCN